MTTELFEQWTAARTHREELEQQFEDRVEQGRELRESLQQSAELAMEAFNIAARREDAQYREATHDLNRLAFDLTKELADRIEALEREVAALKGGAA